MAKQTAMNVYKGLAAGLDALLRIGKVQFTANVINKAASYTVVPAESGSVYETTGATGAVTFTLPAPATTNKGDIYLFSNTVDQNMVISCASKIATLGNAAASTVTFSTASQKIGAVALAVSDGALWHVVALAGTGTVA